MKFNNPYWSIKERIELLQRWIIMHSIIYYELNESLISDKMFNANSIQLMKYKNKYRLEYESSRWYYVMKDFDGATGFDLFGRLESKKQHDLLEEAKWLLKELGGK